MLPYLDNRRWFSRRRLGLLLIFPFLLTSGCALSEKTEKQYHEHESFDAPRMRFSGGIGGGMPGGGGMGGISGMRGGAGMGGMQGGGTGGRMGAGAVIGNSSGPRSHLDQYQLSTQHLLENVVIHRDIPCGQRDSRPLTCDILQAASPAENPVPVVVLLEPETKRDAPPPAQLLKMAAAGEYVCVRLPCRTPIDTSDLSKTPELGIAIPWIMTNGRTHNMNPNRIGCWVPGRESEFLCTLERESADILVSSNLSRNENHGPATRRPEADGVQGFFDKKLRGEEPKLPRTARHGRGQGGGRPGGMFGGRPR